MADGKRISSVAPKVEAMKKAGLSPAMTVVVVLLSSPGFYQAFISNTADDAKKKVEVAYEVLVNEVKHLRDDDNLQREELDRLRSAVLKLSLMNMQTNENARQMAVEAAEEVVAPRRARRGSSIGSASSGSNKGATVEEPKEVRELRRAPVKKSVGKKSSLPGDLDLLMEQKAK